MPRQVNTAIARILRSQLTDAERAIWRHLRSHRFNGAKFKRQQPIGPYVVDFVCFQEHLIIEIDGSQHLEDEADRIRDAWLADKGFRILRFWNNEVLNDMDGVLEKIAEHIPLTPAPSPSGGEGLRLDKAGDKHS